MGCFNTKWGDKFSSEVIEETDEDGNYLFVNENVRVEITKKRDYNANYYVADIYVRDVSYFRTGLAGGEYGRGIRDWTKNIAAENDAVVAVNGDYYGARSGGVVIRNGTLYRKDYSDADVCVLFWDGTMKTYSASQFDVDDAMNAGAYQAWCFGPKLIDDEGNAMEKFHTSVFPNNPRTAIGYIEPGHYCFVVVDGRSDKSKGVNMANLSQIMHSEGCKVAYNLDGGQTSVMAVQGKVYSVPYDGGRKSSDIVYIGK